LKAQGYITKVSSPGSDGGVDILASSGPLGFDSPRILLQVKSSSSPVDVKILRELKGVTTNSGDHRLLVSWGGFDREVERESKSDFFDIRLWDQGQLLNEISSIMIDSTMISRPSFN